MYNYLTSNTSFVELSNQLKKEGIKNCDWMLYLKNENLINVDPYSSSLTLAEKCDITKECYENPMYFLREVVRVRIQNNVSKFKIHKGIAPKIYCWIHKIPSLTLLYRQSFKTHTSMALAMYEFLFNTDQSILIQSKRTDEMYDRMKMFSEMINLIPDYIRSYKEYNTDLKRQCSLLTNKVSNNIIHIGSGIRNSEESFINAANSAKKDTIILFDAIVETLYFHKYIQEISPSVLEGNTYVDFNSIYCKDSIFLMNMWSGVHWNDTFYDSKAEEIGLSCWNIPLTIHYEPDELLSEEEIENCTKVLCNDKKLIRNEMCIKPFDPNY